MKKIFALLLALALLLGFAACGGIGKDKTETTTAAALVPRPLYLVMDIGWGDGPEEYPFEGEATVESLAAGLTAMTGYAFTVTSNTDENGAITIDWSANSSLFDGEAAEPVEGLEFYDYDGMAWFMLDSLCRTIVRSIGVQELFYTMDGGKELVLENLSPPVFFPGPYMLSEYYLNNAFNYEIPEHADVNWWGEYGCEAGILNIVNYNDKGMGWSFHFTFSNGEIEDEGTAAVDPKDPRQAEYVPYVFNFNMWDETIVVTGGDFAGTYRRTDDAVG